MDYSILKEIIALAEAYQQQTNAQRWQKEQFVSWIINEANKTQPKPQSMIPSQDGLISMFLGIAYKYAQFYAKRVFRNTEIYSLDDFAVLVSLFPDKEFKKIDVLRMCIQEKSSGNEVLKRLLRDGMLQERENPADARSKLLSLTDKGRTQFGLIQNGIQKMSGHIVGDLSIEEKNQLLQALMKLHHYHHPYFEENNEDVLKQLLN
ncbi:MarR family winged helix-turn-helix transcriptional regulator [Emticicia sp. 21SJ11W-3]|uniref:MarR family winged helix-turn-helix transcriptional regulator n=1 Tax=Emticicia sp. 21SJ11W-3 TaxID=2916755 RepID=UPI00209CF60D|nr:MarR family winged helix-turn-helix transcriptional regulator [Emticicia sp. 21SJ11W-3]UTA66880.1 MarR family winged helix-turn-helix transcriptional regulator [Emticicia sp. 21SJ11W-3]